MRATHRVIIEAAPELVFKALLDVALYPDWIYGVRRVEILTKERDVAGMQWKQIESFGATDHTHLMELTDATPSRSFVFQSVTRPFVEFAFTIEGEGDRTPIELSFDHESEEDRTATRLAATLARRTLEALKSRLERQRERSETATRSREPGAPPRV